MKIDGWKLCHVYQRPIPRSAEDIGNWQAVMSLIAIIAIITNAGLICFTMDSLEDFKLSNRVWIFFTFQWLLIVVQQLIAYVIPDEPRDYIVQRSRTNFIVDKVIDMVPDEDDDDDDLGEDGKTYESFDIKIQEYPQGPKTNLEMANIDVTI